MITDKILKEFMIADKSSNFKIFQYGGQPRPRYVFLLVYVQ